MTLLSTAHELPDELPQGEHVLWQGAPDWWGLARSLHVVASTVYFALLFAWYAAHAVQAGQASLIALLRMAVLSMAVPILIVAYAWLVSRTASYTLTNRRLVLQSGVALPLSINLPFQRIARADLAVAADGSGNIVLELAASDRLSFVLLWPHAQPWHFARARPMLRAIPDAVRVAHQLARLLETSKDEEMAGSTVIPEQRMTSASSVGFAPLTAAA